ncbi:MAG: hypothetical protein IT384_04040 [Deltaproteobacteria bacterium]|nr:hypothetical protein [Deltaproteobacteria bacterium]
MRWATADGPGRTLVGDIDGAVFRLSLDGTAEQVCLRGGDLVTAASKAGQDRLWVGGPGWVGALDLTTATATAACRPEFRVPLNGAGNTRAIAGSEAGEVIEAFVLADDSSTPHAEALVFRIAGGTVEELGRRSLDPRDLAPPNTGMLNGSVIRLPGGRAAAVFGASDVLWLSSQSGLRIEALPLAPRILSIGISQPLGIVIAAENRFLLWRGASNVSSRAPGGDWSEVAPPPAGGKPQILLPHGRRVTLTWEGAMTELIDGFGYCAPEVLPLGLPGYSPADGALFGEGGGFTIARLPGNGHVLLARPPPTVCGDEND